MNIRLPRRGLRYVKRLLSMGGSYEYGKVFWFLDNNGVRGEMDVMNSPGLGTLLSCVNVFSGRGSILTTSRPRQAHEITGMALQVLFRALVVTRQSSESEVSLHDTGGSLST